MFFDLSIASALTDLGLLARDLPTPTSLVVGRDQDEPRHHHEPLRRGPAEITAERLREARTTAKRNLLLCNFFHLIISRRRNYLYIFIP